MKQAIFFDLDGTLWNALVQLTTSWNLAMSNYNLSYSFNLQKMRKYMGLTPLETVHLAFPDVDEKTGLKYFKICFDEEIKYLKENPGILYPDEEKVLKKLSTYYDLYIVSNADVGYVDNYMNACDMGKYFKGFLCAGDTKLDKKDNIRLLMKKENIDQVIYVGDTAKDMEQALAANVEFIFANYGFGEAINPPNKIDSLNELIPIVNNLFKK